MRLRYIASFIGIVLIFFLIHRFFIMGWRPEQNDISPTPIKLSRGQSLQSTGKQPERDSTPPWSDFVYPAKVGARDPFQLSEPQIEPQIKEKKPPSLLMLTGVLHNEKKSIAIFTDGRGNSYLVEENDAILDFTVKKILKRSVILRRADTDIEFKVFDEGTLLKSKTVSAQIQQMTKNQNSSEVITR